MRVQAPSSSAIPNGAAITTRRDATVRAKALAARRAGLLAIICVGETRAERDAGRARDVVQTQLDGSLPDGAENFVVAYEPVWAIGTGLTPTIADVGDMHGFIRERLIVALRRCRAWYPHSLRRLGEAGERRGADGGRQCRWRASSAAPASIRTSFWRSRAFTDKLDPPLEFRKRRFGRNI